MRGSGSRARGWLLPAVERAGRENLDPTHVARYDAKMPFPIEAELEVLRKSGLCESSVVVDLGAGTGQFAIGAASGCRNLTAVEVAPAMLAALRRNVSMAGVTNVTVVDSGFLSYEPGEPADFAYSRHALHHLPDFWKAVALQRIHELLRPGGCFRLWDLVYSFDPVEATSRVEDWCARADAGGDVETEWIRSELEDHVREEHSTFTWLLEPMLERVGFDVAEAVYSPDGFEAKYLLRRSGSS